MFDGLFNCSSRVDLTKVINHGGGIFVRFDGVICVLAGCGQVDLARTLLKRGVSPLKASPEPRVLTMNGSQSIEVKRWTALHEAALGGQEAFVRMLLEERADLLLKDGIMSTVLEIATLQGHMSIVRLLSAVDIESDERRGTSDEAQGVFGRLAQRIYHELQSQLV